MTNIELIIAMILAAIVGGLVEFLVGLALPKDKDKKPTFRHIFTILIVIGAFSYISVRLSNRTTIIEASEQIVNAPTVSIEPTSTRTIALPTSTVQATTEFSSAFPENISLVRYIDSENIFNFKRPAIFTEETITLGEGNIGQVFFTGEAFENSLAIVFTIISDSMLSDEEWHVWSADALLRKNINPITIIPSTNESHSIYAEWENGAAYFEEDSGIVLMVGINGPILSLDKETGHEIIESVVWDPDRVREAILNKPNE